MKIKNYKLEATIPTTEFGNLRPTLELEGTDLKEMTEVGLDIVKDLHSRFSKTELKEKNTKTFIVDEAWSFLNSFNEDLEKETLEFNGRTHKYNYKGEALMSGSVYASSFYKKFDMQGIAKNCAKTWGVSAGDIADMWGSNGTVSSDFGTAIHKALEHYFDFKSNGKIIVENTDKEDNPALPKHPILRNIIQQFDEIDKTDGEFETEILVTDVEHNRCGIIDRLAILDREKKVCRVQDYKVNVGAEDESSNLKAKAPYDELPKNKLTKYQIQLSFYANILQQSGWTVEGIDVYVLEDVWKVYQLDILDTYVEN